MTISRKTAASGSLSIVRAAGVIILFVAAVAILVSVGMCPSVSSTPTTTTPTTAAAGGTTTTTTVAGGGAVASTTTTVAHTTTTKAEHKGKSTTTTTAPPSATTVVVANSTSVNGLAADYSTVIGAGGWTMKTPIDAATSVPTSAVYYEAGTAAAGGRHRHEHRHQAGPGAADHLRHAGHRRHRH